MKVGTLAMSKLQDSMRVGFIGSGMMCEAIVKGMISEKGGFQSSNIWCCDRNQSRRDVMKTLGCHVDSQSSAICKNSDVIILSVKPHHISEVLSKAEESIQDKLIVSVAAGVTLARLKSLAPENNVVRVMPNTPMLVGASATCYAHNVDPAAAKKLKIEETIETIFGPSGLLYRVDEVKIDAVTGVSGSGPAYAYMFIEAMADAGVQLGLPRDQSYKLAAQTVYGAAKMCLESEGTHPAQLRNRVESPGGTTIAATTSLEHNGFRSAVIGAVNTAAAKSKELGSKN